MNDPDVLWLNRTPSGLKIAAIMPCLMAAMFGLFWVLLISGIRVEIRGSRTAFQIVLPLLSAVSLGIGYFMLCAEWDTEVDRRRRTVRRRWRLGRWTREKILPFDDVNRVELHRDNYARHRYPIYLCGDRDKIPFADPNSEAEARHDADRLAEFLGLELHDRSRDFFGDPPSIRQPTNKSTEGG